MKGLATCRFDHQAQKRIVFVVVMIGSSSACSRWARVDRVQDLLTVMGRVRRGAIQPKRHCNLRDIRALACAMRHHLRNGHIRRFAQKLGQPVRPPKFARVDQCQGTGRRDGFRQAGQLAHCGCVGCGYCPHAQTTALRDTNGTDNTLCFGPCVKAVGDLIVHRLC